MSQIPMKKLNNGVEIPQLGFGVFKSKPGKETYDAVRWALEAGYRHIDTAMIYRNEESVGMALADSGIPREEIFVTTKLWNDDIRAHRTKDALAESLTRLNLSYVDLYLIHWPAEGFADAWAEMEALYDDGKMRAIGVSNFNIHHLEAILEGSTYIPSVNQIELHPRLTQQQLRDYCAEKNIAVEAWSPLGGTGGDLLAHPVLNDIADKYGVAPAQVVLHWDLQNGIIAIPKSIHQDRIAANLEIFGFELSDEDMTMIDNLNENKRVGSDPETFDF